MIIDVVNSWFADVEKDVLTRYESEGHKASGNFARQLRTETEENKGKITGRLIGAHYAYWLENGRGPTAPSKRGRLYGIMLEWVKAKGIASNLQDQKRIAYFVGKKIDEQGYKGKNIISKVVTDARINELQKSISGQIIKEIRTIWQSQQSQ